MVPSTSSTRVNDARLLGWRADRAAIDAALVTLCDRYADVTPSPVREPIRYSLLGGGKRLRGLLFLTAYRAAGGASDATTLAASIEIVHAYSLVHDDLPCMDDDDLRRGRPTVHRVYGVPIATAAGVAMVPLAVRAALDGAQTIGLSLRVGARIVADLMRASGAGGMIGGQLLDLESEGHRVGLAELERVHRGKTGALIETAVALGGVAAGAGENQIAALTDFGSAIGLAFQIADDVLDVTATSDTLGKPAGRDLDLQKSTYPALLGVVGATERAAALVVDACEALRGADLLSPDLEALARLVVEREW